MATENGKVVSGEFVRFYHDWDLGDPDWLVGCPCGRRFHANAETGMNMDGNRICCPKCGHTED